MISKLNMRTFDLWKKKESILDQSSTLNKVKDKKEKQATHTYALIKAQIFMEATKWNKEKIDIIRWYVLQSFFRLFLSVSFQVNIRHFPMIFFSIL